MAAVYQPGKIARCEVNSSKASFWRGPAFYISVNLKQAESLPGHRPVDDERNAVRHCRRCDEDHEAAHHGLLHAHVVQVAADVERGDEIDDRRDDEADQSRCPTATRGCPRCSRTSRRARSCSTSPSSCTC